MQPWAQKLYQERQENNGKDRPSGRCLPHSVTDFDGHPNPKKVIQTPGVIVLLFESYHSYRQIFIDGRPFPKERAGLVRVFGGEMGRGNACGRYRGHQ